MIRFFCGCGAELFFDNDHCAACGALLGFEPTRQRLLAARPDGAFIADQSYKPCALRGQLGCNWLLPTDEAHSQCQSCRLTRTVPNLAAPRNLLRWQRLEQAKRRAWYMLLRLHLPLATAGGLCFDFLEDRRSNPLVAEEFVYSGFRDGVVTLNAAEADDSYRAAAREQMNETYRTLLGHFRHELGHYFWQLLVRDLDELAGFRALFGDEREDYAEALERHYEQGPEPGWRERFVSAYAASHPLEDWAESWAHYLHMRETLETAQAFGAIPGHVGEEDFEYWFAEWLRLSVLLNALNRSMGVEDAYPFVLTAMVKRKLVFIDRLVKLWRTSVGIAARP